MLFLWSYIFPVAVRVRGWQMFFGSGLWFCGLDQWVVVELSRWLKGPFRLVVSLWSLIVSVVVEFEVVVERSILLRLWIGKCHGFYSLWWYNFSGHSSTTGSTFCCATTSVRFYTRKCLVRVSTGFMLVVKVMVGFIPFSYFLSGDCF